MNGLGKALLMTHVGRKHWYSAGSSLAINPSFTAQHVLSGHILLLAFLLLVVCSRALLARRLARRDGD
jgi:hypothetical protein